MGLLKHLLFWPVTAPTALIGFSLRQVEGVARRELTDDDRIKEDLMALQLQWELGEVDEKEFEAREAELMQRLREAREWRTKLGMEEKWAPLEFPRQEPEAGDDAAGTQTDDGGGPWSPGSSRTSPPDSSSS